MGFGDSGPGRNVGISNSGTGDNMGFFTSSTGNYSGPSVTGGYNVGFANSGTSQDTRWFKPGSHDSGIDNYATNNTGLGTWATTARALSTRATTGRVSSTRTLKAGSRSAGGTTGDSWPPPEPRGIRAVLARVCALCCVRKVSIILTAVGLVVDDGHTSIPRSAASARTQATERRCERGPECFYGWA